MKQRKSQRWISLFEELNEFMERNLDKWNTIDEIRNTYDKFIKNLKKIKDLQPELEQDLTPVREELSGKRDVLLEKLYPPGNILEVYAQDHRIGKKARKLVEEWKKLESLGFHRLHDLSRGLYKLMIKYLDHAGEVDKIPSEESSENASTENATMENSIPARDPGLNGGPVPSEPLVTACAGQAESTDDIRRYGLTRPMLQELYIAMQQYRSTLKLRDDVFIYRRKLRRRRDGLVRTNRKLLEKRLNKLITVFAGTHPSFYKEYRAISGNN